MADDWDVPLKPKLADSDVDSSWNEPLAAPAQQAVTQPTQGKTKDLTEKLQFIGQQGYKGALNLLGTAGDVENLAHEYLKVPRLPTGTNDSINNQLFATSEQYQNVFNKDRKNDLVPFNRGERFLGATAGAVPIAMAGNLPGAVSAFTGAVGGQAAAEVMPGNKWAPVVGGVVGALLGGWGTGAIKTFMEDRASVKAAIQAKADYEAAVEAARTGKRAAALDISNIKDTSTAEFNATKDLAAESVEAAERQAQETFEASAKSWGTSVTPQQAGEKLQDAARTWMTKTFPEKMAALKAPLDKAIPADTAVELSNFNGVLQGINKKAGSLQPLVDVMSKAMPRQLAKAADAASEAEGLITNGPTWAEARTLRSALGDAMKDPELISKIGESNLKALYKAATADLTATAKANGAEEVWKAFNEGSTKLHNFVDNTLSKVISSTDKVQESIKPEDIATALLNGGKKGGTDLAALQAEMPGAVSELSSVQLVQGSKAWNSLKPEAKAVLVPDPAQRASLDQMVKNTETAAANAKAEIRKATREHAADLKAANDDAAAGNYDLSTARVEAKKRLAEAAAKTNKGNSIEGIQESLRGIRKSGVGVLAANMLSPFLHSIPGAIPALEFGAAVAPGVLKWGKGLITNPQNALGLATGAAAGSNALAVKPPG